MPMKESLNRWLHKQGNLEINSPEINSLCDSLGLTGDKIDSFYALVWQMEKGDINEAEFTAGLSVITEKEPEEVMGVLKGMSPVPQKVSSRKSIEDVVRNFLEPYLHDPDVPGGTKLQIRIDEVPPSFQRYYGHWDELTKTLEIYPPFDFDLQRDKDALVVVLAHELGHAVNKIPYTPVELNLITRAENGVLGAFDEITAANNGIVFADKWGIGDLYRKDVREGIAKNKSYLRMIKKFAKEDSLSSAYAEWGEAIDILSKYITKKQIIDVLGDLNGVLTRKEPDEVMGILKGTKSTSTLPAHKTKQRIWIAIGPYSWGGSFRETAAKKLYLVETVSEAIEMAKHDPYFNPWFKKIRDAGYKKMSFSWGETETTAHRHRTASFEIPNIPREDVKGIENEPEKH